MLKKILVVDDNESFTELISMVFKDEFEVIEAHDGERGIQIAIEDKPDLILLDVMMPKITGLEMLRQLQADVDARNIPVVILTATKFDPAMEKVFESEPNVRSFLKKPCGIELMRDRVFQVLGNPDGTGVEPRG